MLFARPPDLIEMGAIVFDLQTGGEPEGVQPSTCGEGVDNERIV